MLSFKPALSRSAYHSQRNWQPIVSILASIIPCECKQFSFHTHTVSGLLSPPLRSSNQEQKNFARNIWGPPAIEDVSDFPESSYVKCPTIWKKKGGKYLKAQCTDESYSNGERKGGWAYKYRLCISKLSRNLENSPMPLTHWYDRPAIRRGYSHIARSHLNKIRENDITWERVFFQGRNRSINYLP